MGGGTGMICYEFKGGIGTASRKLDAKDGGYTVGVLVQCNCGSRDHLTIAGVPVGREIPENKVWANAVGADKSDQGSIIIVVATDAPLLPHQLKRLARRASLGLARTGSDFGQRLGRHLHCVLHGQSGRPQARGPAPTDDGAERRDWVQLFEATVEATEEAIVNALVAAETMTGADNHTVIALPHVRPCCPDCGSRRAASRSPASSPCAMHRATASP